MGGLSQARGGVPQWDADLRRQLLENDAGALMVVASVPPQTWNRWMPGMENWRGRIISFLATLCTLRQFPLLFDCTARLLMTS